MWSQDRGLLRWVFCPNVTIEDCGLKPTAPGTALCPSSRDPHIPSKGRCSLSPHFAGEKVEVQRG